MPRQNTGFGVDQPAQSAQRLLHLGHRTARQVDTSDAAREQHVAAEQQWLAADVAAQHHTARRVTGGVDHLEVDACHRELVAVGHRPQIVGGRQHRGPSDLFDERLAARAETEHRLGEHRPVAGMQPDRYGEFVGQLRGVGNVVEMTVGTDDALRTQPLFVQHLVDARTGVGSGIDDHGGLNVG